MNQNKLQQLQNNVEVIGTLKSKELEVKETLDGRRFMSGKLVVQSIVDGKMNEHNIEVFTAGSSKLFQGVETVKNEYKTIDEHGIESADRIRVKGALKLKEYYNNEGKLIQYNIIRGMIFNRLDKDSGLEDKAFASIETIIERVKPILENDLPTGSYSVDGFTVGWKGEVIELKDVVVEKELTQAFMDLYQPGSTGRLSFKLNSFVEEKKQVAATTGFGIMVDIKDTFETGNKYTNVITVIGGDMPYLDSRKYTSKDIETSKQSRRFKLQEMKEKFNISKVPVDNGFGLGIPKQRRITISMPPGAGNNGIPNF
ncbi:hypothetical protein P4T04_15595 [Bacillus badius]|uniref:hypothetical protein n=1 Tax=Bacillus badius TaxID=1455 RepID=UPI002E1AA5B3|nr:hypothetical protein [Bacillus badius]